jgi:hypothetical protein
MINELVTKIVNLREHRLTICNTCPSNKFGVCFECACPIQTKILLESSTCPLNKWNIGEQNDSDTI